MSVADLLNEFDAVCLTVGARYPRDLQVPGRELNGIHFAVDFLRQQNKTVHGDPIPTEEQISAKDKHVVVIGGGDTGSDCVGTSIRQGAKSVMQLEILPKPPVDRPAHQPWPLWATVYKTSSSHKEGCERKFAVSTKAIHGSEGQVTRIDCVEVEWDTGKWSVENARSGWFGIPTRCGFNSTGNGLCTSCHGRTCRGPRCPYNNPSKYCHGWSIHDERGWCLCSRGLVKRRILSGMGYL
jgi:NADPH-dependent glutamate synthase beta subunit-like oxidoreductase